MSHDDWTEDGQQATTQTASGLWPAGNYDGTLIDGTLVSSQMKGTPGIQLRFEVQNVEKIVNVWITDASAEIAVNQLEAIGWNGNMAAPEFSKVGQPCKLYMKHGMYKNKPKEEWQISSFTAKPPPAATDPMLTRFAARFKAKVSTPAPPPTRPTPPPPAAAGKGPPPPKAAASKATTMEEAWAAWTKGDKPGDEDKTAELFYKQVEIVAGTTDTSNVTPEQWNSVAAAAPPFN